MPTVGWILEDAEERYWENLESIPAQQYFLCPYCDDKFNSQSDLDDHVADTHFLDLPILIVRGHPIASQSIIRNPLDNSEVHLLNCTNCRVIVNVDKTLDLEPLEFRRLLVDERNAHWDITLLNAPLQGISPSEHEYKVDFQIPDKHELDNADHLFIKHLAIPSPKHADIKQFMANCDVSPQGRDYLGALTDYVVGIMIKDQDDSLITTMPFEEHKSKFLASRNVLSDFFRPVPQTIKACIDFNLNGFTGTLAQLRVDRLRDGHDLFTTIAKAEQLSPHSYSSRTAPIAPVCPVDVLTERLLLICEQYTHGGAMSVETAQFLEDLPTIRPVSEYDLPKIHVLCSLIYLKNRRRPAAERHLRKLQFDSLFGNWARKRLEHN